MKLENGSLLSARDMSVILFHIGDAEYTTQLLWDALKHHLCTDPSLPVSFIKTVTKEDIMRAVIYIGENRL